MQIRRPEHCFLRLEPRRFLALDALLAAQIRWHEEPRVLVTALLDDGEQELERQEVETWLRIPATWTPIDHLVGSTGLRRHVLESLLTKGLVLSDCDTEPHRRRRQVAELRAEQGWYPPAAYYHGLARWQGVQGAGTGGPGAEGLTAPPAQLPSTPPPATFYRPTEAGSAVSLPTGDLDSALGELLSRRQTCRAFDPTRPLPRDTAATLLRQTFGPSALAERGGGLTLLRKSSPSGGALHPIEAYVLVQRVETLAPGLYHYDVEHHALRPIQALARDQVRRAILEGAAGQAYFADAPMACVLVARFERNFWKYHDHQKAYRVLLLDAGHLGQTFALLATELGLGVFFTSAINEIDLEGLLRLDPVQEGVLAMVGAGPRGETDPALEFSTEPFVPRSLSTSSDSADG